MACRDSSTQISGEQTIQPRIHAKNANAESSDLSPTPKNHVNSAVPPKTLKHKEISGGGVGSGVVSTPLLRYHGVNLG